MWELLWHHSSSLKGLLRETPQASSPNDANSMAEYICKLFRLLTQDTAHGPITAFVQDLIYYDTHISHIHTLAVRSHIKKLL